MPHRLCCQSHCAFNQSSDAPGGGYIQRLHGKIRYEGLGFASMPHAINGPGTRTKETKESKESKGGGQITSAAADGIDLDIDIDDGAERLIPLFVYTCPVDATGNATANATDYALGPADWKPVIGPTCTMLKAGSTGKASAPAPEMYVYKSLPKTTTDSYRYSNLVALEVWYKPGDHYTVASDAGKADAKMGGYQKVETLGFVWPAPGTANASSSRYPLPSISKDDPDYKDQDYWHGRIWGPMIQLVYWGLEQYQSETAKGAAAGLVAQSKALLMKEWQGSGSDDVADPNPWGHLVFENYGADTGNGWEASSSATPLYSWGALTGFIGLQANGFYDPLPAGAGDVAVVG